MQRNLTKEDQQKWSQLGLYKDEQNIIRCRGRIQAKHLPRDTIEPILLLPNQHLTHLIVRDTRIRNATNFKYSNEILSMEDTDTVRVNTTIQTFLTNEKIRWKFITPLSPCKGGFYERLIGMIKLTLKRVLTRKLPDETTFLTTVLECEAMVNSRPLACAGSTLEYSLIIHPIDILFPKANLLPFSGTITIDDNHDTEYLPYVSTKDQAIQYYRTQMTYLKCLWHEWHNTYLLELRNFHQHRIKQKSFTRTHPKIGRSSPCHG
ncbi:unnamed protein product [Haemonchus placei]|uniref:DUF5641 domain-containing protein n=1 Tax=Haemonchus placei TaxID=6290 RepID=A0A0N4X104_HAEPC|nr:unnamed protein product [Haemonchus placei]